MAFKKIVVGYYLGSLDLETGNRTLQRDSIAQMASSVPGILRKLLADLGEVHSFLHLFSRS